VAVGEDLAANRKIEEMRRFSELSVSAVSRFADILRYCSGQSGSRDFFSVLSLLHGVRTRGLSAPQARTVRGTVAVVFQTSTELLPRSSFSDF
jgi:hypothetical protein